MGTGEAVEIAIVGGGIAGMSAAYFLSLAAPDRTIGLFETEETLTHHTTGRSAAVYIENYGALPIRALTKASRSFFFDPPDDLVDGPVLTTKGYLAVARPEAVDAIDRLVEEGRAINPAIGHLEPSEAIAMAPMLRAEAVAAALYEPDASDIDVAGLHQAYVRGFRRAGGIIATTRRVDAAKRQGDGWLIETTTGPVHANLLVNASGAWGDQVAATAGVTPVGLVPKRRTAFMVNSPFDGSEDWPLVADAGHAWYANPDGRQFLCSPADETPSEPLDAKPEELDIAMAIERINAATTLDIRSVASSWAGLRTFAPDGSMVIGPDPDQPTFLWCVGQGGTGIQTSPGAGQLLADLAISGSPGTHFDGTGLDLSKLLPDRFR